VGRFAFAQNENGSVREAGSRWPARAMAVAWCGCSGTHSVSFASGLLRQCAERSARMLAASGDGLVRGGRLHMPGAFVSGFPRQCSA
jgi:hypothetical protein